MYVAGPPSVAKQGGTSNRPLRLVAVHRREFGATGHYLPQDVEYLTDMLATFGMLPRKDAFESGRTTFRDMAAALISPMGDLDDDLDMAILAHTTPDAEAGWPMALLAEAVPALGLGFAISDQGIVAPFTALKLIWQQAQVGVTRAIVWVMDQSATPHDRPIPEHREASKNAAVALVLSHQGALGTLSFAEQHVPRDHAEVRDLLDAGLLQLAKVGEPVTVVCGAAVRPYMERNPLVGDIRVAQAGQPCTGIWFAFADSLAARQPVLVADYDEELGYLGMCGVLRA